MTIEACRTKNTPQTLFFSPCALIVLMIFGVAIAGCSFSPKQGPTLQKTFSSVSYAYPDWLNDRQALLYRHSTWEWQGRAFIQYKDKTQRVNMVWKKQRDTQYLSLSGAMGFGRVDVSVTQESAKLTVGEKVVAKAQTLDQLLWEYFVWPITAKRMIGWLWGIDELGRQAEFDQAGQLTHLVAEGWSLGFSDYRFVQGVALPHKIRAQREKDLFKLKISQWRLTEDG